MAATGKKKKREARTELVRGARMGSYALGTALVGTIVGGITLALLVLGAHTALQQNDSSIDLSQAWENLGRRGALVLGGLMFLSYLVATLVAGRMAWRRGWLHGLAAEVDLRDRIEANSNVTRADTAPAAAPPEEPSQEPDTRRKTVSEKVDVDSLTKEELYELAAQRDIPGRSQMTKEQLRDAVVERR